MIYTSGSAQGRYLVLLCRLLSRRWREDNESFTPSLSNWHDNGLALRRMRRTPPSALPQASLGWAGPLDPIIIGWASALAGFEPGSFDSRFVRHGPSSVTTQLSCQFESEGVKDSLSSLHGEGLIILSPPPRQQAAQQNKVSPLGRTTGIYHQRARSS